MQMAAERDFPMALSKSVTVHNIQRKIKQQSWPIQGSSSSQEPRDYIGRRDETCLKRGNGLTNQ